MGVLNKLKGRRPGRRTAIVLAAFLAALATVAGLLSRASFSAATLQRHPSLGFIDNNRLLLFVVAIVSLVLGFGAVVWKDLLAAKSSRNARERGEAKTLEVFDAELDASLRAVEKTSRDFYIAGLHDQTTGRLAEAAGNFRKSIDALPTIGGYLGLGYCLWRLSSLSDAKEALEKGLQLAQERGIHSRKPDFHLNLGAIASHEGHLSDAMAHFRNAEHWSGVQRDKLGRAKALGNVGIVYDAMGNHGEACKCYQQAFEQHKPLSPIDAIIDLVNLARSEMKRGRLKEAMARLTHALDLEKSFPDLVIRGNVKLSIAQILYQQGQFSDSLARGREAEEIHRTSSHRIGQVGALCVMGSSMSALGRSAEGEALLRRALDLQRETGSPDVSEPVNAIGLALLDQGRFAEAADKFQEAISTMDRTRVIDRAYATMNLGVARLELKQIGAASNALQDALEMFGTRNDPGGQAHALLNWGRLSWALGETVAAKSAWERSRDLFHRITSPHGEAMALSNLGNLEAAKGNGEAARELYAQAIRILRPMSVRDAAIAIGNVARTHWRDGNIPEAFAAATEARDLIKNLGPSHLLRELDSLLDALANKKER